MKDLMKGVFYGGLLGFWVFMILLATGVATADAVVWGTF